VLEIDIEHIFGLRPDLVLATGLTQPQQVEGLRRLGIRVERFREPRSFAEIREQFRAIGSLLGMERRAAEILESVDMRLQEVGNAVSRRKRPRVLLQIGAQPLFIATGSSFTHDFIELAGGSNIGAGASSGRYSEEMVMAARPDLIIVAMMGSQENVAERERRRWLRLYSRLGRESPRVVLLDSDLICSPTPETFVEGLSRMAILIHPELAGRDLLSLRR
jgi:iron complex transport system substrate-binding protein